MYLSKNIGNTPLVKISDKILAKFEGSNPSGSIKDRMASWILNDAKHNKLIKEGDTIIEATSGNTGISLAMLGAERGYKVIIVMPSNMSEERKKMLKFYGADLIEVEAGNFDMAIQVRDNLTKEFGYFNTNQFYNPINIDCHYATTGVEILEQFKNKIGAFVAGTGTGGTLMGTSKRLKMHHKDMLVVAAEPSESPVMSGGEPGLHGIQGIGDGSKFLVDLSKVNKIITISTNDAKERAIRLAKENGLFVGISSGCNVLAAERILEEMNIDGSIITILSDRGERYMSCL